MTAQGHPRVIFERALEHGNALLAQMTARELGRITLEEALTLTALVAQKEPGRRSRYAVRWLLRLLQEDDQLTIEEAALAASALEERQRLLAGSRDRDLVDHAEAEGSQSLVVGRGDVVPLEPRCAHSAQGAACRLRSAQAALGLPGTRSARRRESRPLSEPAACVASGPTQEQALAGDDV